MGRQLSDPLTEDDKAWLRSWNRQGEIPGEEGGVQQLLVPGNPPGNEITKMDGPPDETDPFNGEEPPEDYNDWTGPQLSWELGNRSLPKTGKKSDLVARLEEDDANSSDDDDEDTP